MEQDFHFDEISEILHEAEEMYGDLECDGGLTIVIMRRSGIIGFYPKVIVDKYINRRIKIKTEINKMSGGRI
jgi:hypothetical protein